MALKDIKTKIKATERMHKVTRAMEAVSAVKMRKTQSSAFAGRPYARAALQILARLSGSGELARHAIARAREVKRTALVVITSDKGLAGALNSAVLKSAYARVSTLAKDSVVVYAYGKKGEDFFRARGYEVVGAFENNHDDIVLAEVEALAGELSKGFLAESFDEVVAVYSNFKSTFEQVPTARKLLPLSVEGIAELVADIQPVRGKWSEPQPITAPASYTVEPSVEHVLDVLIPKLVAASLYHMLLEGKASEHSARMVAMKNASEKSEEVAEALTKKFNKIRQAAITREVSEIVSGREALAA